MIGMSPYTKPLIFCLLLVALFVTAYMRESSRSAWKEPDWKKISPFTAVSFDGEKVLAEYDGTVYELKSIEGVDSRDLIAAAKSRFRGRWQKRIREDIAEVLEAAGVPETTFVDLVLEDLKTGELKRVPDVEMTRENRSIIYGAL